MSKSIVNSFSALGFAKDEAVIEALRADLADIVRGYIERSQMPQVALARQLGIPQSTISAIKNDKIDHLSIEYFVRVLARVGISWTAKCWNAPHDAVWVAGGISQLLAADESAKLAQSPVPVHDYWAQLASSPGFANYTLSGTRGAIRVTHEPMNPGHENA